MGLPFNAYRTEEGVFCVDGTPLYRYLTRDEAVAIFGEEIIAQLDEENCEWSSSDDNDVDEWRAIIETPDHDKYDAVALCFVTTAKHCADAKDEEACVNWENVDWEDAKAGYLALEYA